jgi:hypothetical protein
MVISRNEKLPAQGPTWERDCACPIHLKGTGSDGKQVRQALKTSDWTKAGAMLKERTAGATVPATEPRAKQGAIAPEIVIHVYFNRKR